MDFTTPDFGLNDAITKFQEIGLDRMLKIDSTVRQVCAEVLLRRDHAGRMILSLARFWARRGASLSSLCFASSALFILVSPVLPLLQT